MNDLDDLGRVFVGRKPCGCVTLVCAETAAMAPAEVVRCMRLGETVSLINDAAYRTLTSWRCADHPRPEKTNQMQLQEAL